LDFRFWIGSTLKGCSLFSWEEKKNIPLERGGLKPIFLSQKIKNLENKVGQIRKNPIDRWLSHAEYANFQLTATKSR
jgi:hypothetical protein